MLELGCLSEGEYGASQACQTLVEMPPHHGVVVQLYGYCGLHQHGHVRSSGQMHNFHEEVGLDMGGDHCMIRVAQGIQ